MLGHAVDPVAGAFLASTVRAPVAADDQDFDGRFGKWLYEHGGRFVAVLIQPRPLVYPDGYALLPVLFRAETECIASSPFLLPDRDGRLVQAPVATTVDVAGGLSEWFPLATTPLEGVDRLLSDHVLDLQTWRQHRHWPMRAPEPMSVEEAAERIAAAIEPSALAAARAGHPRMGLTAGGDTRAVLACARAVVDEFEFVTIVPDDDDARTDEVWASKISSRFGLAHRVVRTVPATPEDERLFFYRTGALNGNLRSRGTGPTWAAALRTPGPVLAGGAGDVLRAGHVPDLKGWKRYARLETDALDPADVLQAMGAPPELRDRAEALLAGIPPMAALDALQLVLNESCSSCWHGTLTLPVPEMDPLLHPLTQRAVTEATLGVPLQDRLDDRLRKAVIALRWPELLEFPFNRDPFPVLLRRRLARARGYARAARRRIRRHDVLPAVALALACAAAGAHPGLG